MRENSDKCDDLNRIRDLAASWVIKHDHGLSAAEQDELNEWLVENTEHREAYHLELKSWGEFDRLVGLHDTTRSPVNPDLLDDDKIISAKKPVNHWRALLSLPIAAALILGFVFLQSYFSFQPREEPIVSAQSDIIERIKQVRLEDGSVISLNRGADFKAEYTKKERLVRLFDGEVSFDVSKDSSRPFVVEVYGVRLRAVGTVFNVRFIDQKVDVIVTEGVVALEHEDAVEELESFLQVNQRATVSVDGSFHQTEIVEMVEEEVAKELLWQPVLVDFANARLIDIVEEFNRRNPVTIVIHDPELRNMRLSSVFWSDNVNGFIRLLEGKFGVQAQIREHNIVYLYKS